MKGSTILTILVATVTSVIISVESEQNKERIELLYPSGFRISLKDDYEFYKFRFHGNINEDIKDLSEHRWLEEGQYLGNFELQRSGEWTYQNLEAPLKPGDTLNYYIQKYYVPGISAFGDITQYRVPANASRVIPRLDPVKKIS